MQRDKVVLVDQQDNALGEMNKMEAHLKGLLHRAFSIFVFNSKGEMLIHQRAKDKYHGGGLWTNACCSHPQLSEDIRSSALERLEFEMGMQCEIKKAFSFIYNATVENGLIEHEYDHVYIGLSDTDPVPNAAEVQSYRWIDPGQLLTEIQNKPETFTFWFREAVRKVIKQRKRVIDIPL